MPPPTFVRSTDPALLARRCKPILAGLIVGWISALAIAIAIAAAIIEFGLFDVTALSSHSRPLAWVLHTTMVRAVRNGARRMRVPARFTAEDVRQGFRIYDPKCAMCHGGPGIARAQWASGLTPTPPFLLEAARNFSPVELRFIVGKGVKMTGMPAWRLTVSDRELWSVVAFLEKLPSLSQRDYLAMRAAARSGTAAPHRATQP